MTFVSLDRVVIVGAGLAGLRAAESLRENRHRGEIVIVGEEIHYPYNRSPLSKSILLGKQAATDIAIPFTETLGVNWKLGSQAAALEVSNRILCLARKRGLLRLPLLRIWWKRPNCPRWQCGAVGLSGFRHPIPWSTGPMPASKQLRQRPPCSTHRTHRRFGHCYHFGLTDMASDCKVWGAVLAANIAPANSKFLAIARRDNRIVGVVGMNMPGALASWKGRIGIAHD
jgi:pyridine nucleotide-disulfide oxidoreductase